VRQVVGGERTYRLRVGVYRVIYQVDDASRLVTVLHVRHRKDAYR
jgi:mRNA interferase RelE/StbE